AEKDLPTGEFTVRVYQKKPEQNLSARTFRIEAYKIPTFELQLAAPLAARLDGPFQVRAVAKYYAGGSVAGQPIAWTVTRYPYAYVPKGLPDYLFADSSQFARPGSARAAGPITRQAKLDDKGADSITVNPALDIDGSPRIYHFEATVTGADNQEVSAMQDVKALPPFVLGMKLPRWSEHPFTLEPDVIAVGVDGKLLAGQDVSVRLYRRLWHSQLRETDFSTGKAQYDTQQEDQKITEVKVTTAGAPVKPAFELKDSGVYVVELFARDRLGRVQTLSADLYVGGRTPVAWEKAHQGTFQVATDQKSYAPGDVARLLIQSPFAEGHALVVVERPEGNEYAWVDVSGGKGERRIAIRGNNVPNLPVHVVLMRGRLGEGEDDSRFRPETVAATTEIAVRPVENEAIVHVGHPDSARPGTTVKLNVRLADDRGRPLAGEVTLWLVDAAVLSLAREQPLDPLPHFIDRNQEVSSIRDSRNQVVGALLEQEEPGGGEGGGEGGMSMTQVVRKNFQTVPYWAATLEVPSSGRLTIPVKLSDDLTNFRVRAVAIAGDRRFGFEQTTLHVRLPVLVQPELPRFVRQGDRFWGGGVVRLVEGAEGPGDVRLRIHGPAEAAGPQPEVRLALSQAQSVVAPIEVRATDTPTATLKIQMQVTRRSDGVGDAFEVKLPVLPDRPREHFGYFDRLAAGSVTFKPFPEPPRAGTASQDLLFTAVPGIVQLAAGLDYLGGYPHGCLEQRVSRVFPAVAEAELVRSLGLAPGYLDRAAADARVLLGDLPGFQDDQGFFAFWPGSPGDVQLTAETVLFLQAARRAGLPVDGKIEARATAALQRVLRSDYPGFLPGWRYEQQTSALRALAGEGELDEHYASTLFTDRGRLDVEGLADLALALQSRPAVFGDDLGALRRDLWDSVVFQLHEGRPVFERLDWRRSGWNGRYLETKTSAIAAVFEGLLDLDPTNERQPLLRDALLASSDSSEGFGSTHDNWRGLEALAAYLEKAPLPGADTRVEIGGAGVLAVNGAHKVARTEVASGRPLSATVSGDPVQARIAYSYLPATPGDHAAPLAQGFVVSRSETVIHPDGTSEPDQDDVPGETRRLAVGDVVELHTTLVSDEDHSHVALIVPLPAGLEPLNPALANAGADAQPSQTDSLAATYVQRLDDEVRYYFTDLPRGSYSFHFRARAITEGSFTEPPPHAELMYHQEVRGRGAGMRVIVTGAHEK
ncbi:MAG TPA: alpha-2-macroglobulin family protein, partial [Myxococcales bacterium]|nr:alpha-2-macroglobulin family protein [Myxococcales bacterium]